MTLRRLDKSLSAFLSRLETGLMPGFPCGSAVCAR